MPVQRQADGRCAQSKDLENNMSVKIDFLENDKKFMEAIGAFVIAFSKVEYGLGILCALTEYDLRRSNVVFAECVGLSLENKIRRITEFINNELPELESVWKSIKDEIALLNEERRYIVHGIHDWTFPRDTIRSRVRKGKELISKNHSLSDIKKLINRLAHVETGEYGVNGEFYNMFTKARIDKWNKLVSDQNKIVFRLNGKIVSEWRGRD